MKPVLNPYMEALEAMGGMEDFTVHSSMFTIFPELDTPEKTEYEQLINDLYDPTKPLWPFEDIPERSTWTKDGALRIYVVYYEVMEERNKPIKI